MKRPSKKRIAKAIKHFPCHHCGAVGAGFVLYEARILHQRYDVDKGVWEVVDSSPVDGYDEEVVVRCAECDEPIIAAGRPLGVEEFGEWLDQFTEYHEYHLRRREERANVQEEFARRQAEGFLCWGETKAFKDRLKNLE